MNELTEKKNSNFDMIIRKAKQLSCSDLVPPIYKGETKKAISNCMIALNVAERIGADPLMVMQNMHIIQGKPSWSSSFIISALNSCGRFSALKFKMNKEKTSCFAYATEKETGEVLEAPAVTMEMAKAEGWISKGGSKWKTMPELMLHYRSAAFFGRLYAPDILNGMHTVEEVADTVYEPVNVTPEKPVEENDILDSVINDLPDENIETPHEKENEIVTPDSLKDVDLF